MEQLALLSIYEFYEKKNMNVYITFIVFINFILIIFMQ